MINEKNTNEETKDMTPIVKPKLDVIFKMIFGNPENVDILSAFLAAVFKVPKESIGEIEFENVEMLPVNLNDKYVRLDVKLRVNGKKINIEMQICYDADYTQRILFYWAKMFTADFMKGEAYGELPNTVSINILNHNMFDCEEYHSHFQILETTRHEKFSENLSLHFFELPKAVKVKDDSSEIIKWLKLIDAETEEDLKMAENTTVPEIKKAVTIIRHLSADEKVQEAAFQREQALHLEASLIGAAEKRGRQQGIEIGQKRGIRAGGIIFRMQNEGKTDEEIISELVNELDITAENAREILENAR